MNKHRLASTLAIFCLAIPQADAGIFDADYNEFMLPGLGFSVPMPGADGTLTVYVSGANIDTTGKITGSGRRIDFAAGLTSDSTTTDVTITYGQLSPPTTETQEETFTRRISGRNVQLKREQISKSVAILAELSDGCIIKGQWSYNLKREQTAVLRNGRFVYSWKNLEAWYSGQAFAWYQGKVGTTMLGE